MTPSNQRNLRQLASFIVMIGAIAAAFIFGYLQIRPATGDHFIRLMNIGKNYYDQGDASNALVFFERAAAINPAHPDVQMNLANANLLAGRAEEAIRHAREVLRLEPNSPAPHFVMGCAHLRQSRFQEAVKELQTSKDIDRTVNAVSFQLGRAYQGWGRFEEAAAEFREVIEFEEPGTPHYTAAHYSLGQVLLRLGETEEAHEILMEHQKLLAALPSRQTDISTYERSVLTRARVPFVLEQPARTGIKVAFSDATADFFGSSATNYHGPFGVLDINHRGTNDLFVMEGQSGFRLLLNINASFQPQGELLPAIPGAAYWKCLVGDLNNNRMEDVIMIGDRGLHAFRFATNGAASDATEFANLSDSPGVDGVLVDLDFTGKLDLLLVEPQARALRVLRNLGNMYFTDITATSGVPAGLTAVSKLAIDDWNNNDIMDVFVARQGLPPSLLIKERGGLLSPAEAPPSWPVADALAVGDLNNDLRNDVAIATAGRIELFFAGRTDLVTLPAADFPVAGLLLLDYDNDGWLDICAYGNGIRIWRNLGQSGFRNMSSELGLEGLVPGPVEFVAPADFDNDGDTDLLLSLQGGGVRMLRNNGGNANNQLKLRLEGNTSNFTGIGVRIEATADNWRTSRTVTRLPIEIGVGSRRQLDSLNIHWTQLAGSAAELPVDSRSTLTMVELTLPTGSCPYLYAWDGEKFRFVTDLLGASPAGLPIAQGRLIEADPDEYVRVGDELNLQPRDGYYVLQITEELREVLYLDEAKLVVADHPADAEVHPTDKLLPSKPYPPSELITVHRPYPLKSAHTLCGSEVTDLLKENDEKLVSPAKLRIPQLRGLAEPHGVILDFGPLPVNRPLVLVLSGWLRFGGGMANIAASHDPNLPFPFPVLEVETGQDQWQPVDVNVGTPAGKTKTIVADLAGKLPPGSRRLKLSTAFELHWDRIALFERHQNPVTIFTRLAPCKTDLHWRGFSEFKDLPWYYPLTPDYDRVNQKPGWRITPSGWCTRYGPADELIAESDDALVILNGGDELTLSFSASRLPEKPAGYTRTFFLYSVGWDKDADFHVVAGTTVEPIPFHGMDDQRYGQPQDPVRDREWWIEKYNSRWVGPKTFDRTLRFHSQVAQ
jgi:Flp pilus assembly protein TadD